MKKLQEIEAEYKDYKPKTEVVTNLDEFLSYIEIGIDDTDEYQKDYEKELKENKRWALEAKIRNFFFFIFQEEDTDFYTEDDRILQECIDYTKLFRTYYERIKQLANGENFAELLKLVDFSTDYYNSQMDYYDYLRDRLEMIMKGFSLYNPNYDDSKEAFTTFMSQKLSNLEARYPQEKTKVYEKVSQ